MIPGNLRVNAVYRGQMEAEQAKASLMEAINRGQKIVNYMGHGSVNLWRGSMLTSADAATMSNRNRLSLFVMMTCLNGHFDDPALESLAESLLKADGGAVAVWASSGVCLPNEQSTMNQAFYRALFGGKAESLSLGEAIGRAKASVRDVDVRRTWVLLGDPSMKLR